MPQIRSRRGSDMSASAHARKTTSISRMQGPLFITESFYTRNCNKLFRAKWTSASCSAPPSITLVLLSQRPLPTTTEVNRQRRQILLAALTWMTPTPTRAKLPPRNRSAEYEKYADQYDALETSTLASWLGLVDLRRRALRDVYGDVLEIGVGTALNLPYYDTSRVRSFTGVDLSQSMLDKAKQRADAMGFPVRLFPGDASALVDVADRSFDCVVLTYSLCTIQQPLAALREMTRVCRDSGRIIVLEHARSSSALVALYQDATSSVAQAMSKGCRGNLDLSLLLQQAGLEVLNSEPHLFDTVRAVVARPASRESAKY